MSIKHDLVAAALALVAILSLGSSIAGFAHPLNGLSPADSPFRLPVGPGLMAYVFQGNAGDPHTVDHVGAQAYAFDFTVGTSNFVVVAASSGTVIWADDSSSTHCDDGSCWTTANYVLIQNDAKYSGVNNGQPTAALYLHFLKGSLKVRPGYHVQQGDVLGLADTTGWATGPHLHFQVEQVPPQKPTQQNIQQLPAGWWFTRSMPIQFSNPEVSAQSESKDGVPHWNQTFLVSGKAIIPNILPGGQWISPMDRASVTDTIHFAAWAYPTHASDPAIKYVKFTINIQGTWSLACPPVLPPTSTPGPAATPLPESPPAPGAQVFTCDANLKDLGVPSGPIQVSFDVYDMAGNVNLAPNGVHTLTYALLLELEVNPTSFTVHLPLQGPPCDHEVDISILCTLTLSAPNSNSGPINWSTTETDTCLILQIDPSSGTIQPGQQETVILNLDMCEGGGGTVTFFGGANPVIVNWTWP